MRSSIVAHFVDYAELLFREFAGKVWRPTQTRPSGPTSPRTTSSWRNLAAVIKFRELQAELPDLQHASIGNRSQ
eukprot:jgi/Tetstr1/445371/TSEL_003384.t1